VGERASSLPEGEQARAPTPVALAGAGAVSTIL